MKNEDEAPVYTFADLERMGEGTYYGILIMGKKTKRKGWESGRVHRIGPTNITYATGDVDLNLLFKSGLAKI